MSTNILGISAYYHDSAAVLLVDGQIKAATHEERFSRIKHDASFPSNAIEYSLAENQLSLDEIDYIVYYEKPFIKFERLLETYLSYAPRGLNSFLHAIPVWIKEKLFLKTTLSKELNKLSGASPDRTLPLMFTDHHQSHAGSAFFPSPFQNAAVLCLDGVGEWTTSSVWSGQDNTLTPLWEIRFPHSLGLLYSAFTYYTGFKVNSGEYKLMGLAPYGEPKYVGRIEDHLIDIKPDGTFRLNMDYFNYAAGLTMTNERFNRLFNGPPRQPETALTQKEMDIAKSIQTVAEKIVLKLSATIKKETGHNHLCLAGGVALNCVANGKLQNSNLFDHIWVQPASGDAGGALGSALCIWHEYLENERACNSQSDKMQGAYLGPGFSKNQIKSFLDRKQTMYEYLDEKHLFSKTAQLLKDGQVCGWFQGRMEYGPRALGNRSILGDPRSAGMQSVINSKIKFRESFRPFAPAVKSDKSNEWFDGRNDSPYMLMVSHILDEKKEHESDRENSPGGLEKIKIKRSQIPAVTHVDYSARIQTVHKNTNPRFYQLIDAFEHLTDCPVLVNTSFNVRGEPIVCSPEEAFRCFMQTQMDYLIMGNFLLAKKDQKTMETATPYFKKYKRD